MDRDAIAELFASFGPVDVRRVFSGFGIYADDVCFALYLRGDLYLNADEATIPRFVAAGSAPFSYATAQRHVSVNSYWRMPAHLYDDPTNWRHGRARRWPPPRAANWRRRRKREPRHPSR